MRGGASCVDYHVLEAWAVLEADVLVHVSRRMQEHIVQKHPWAEVQPYARYSCPARDVSAR